MREGRAYERRRRRRRLWVGEQEGKELWQTRCGGTDEGAKDVGVKED